MVAIDDGTLGLAIFEVRQRLIMKAGDASLDPPLNDIMTILSKEMFPGKKIPVGLVKKTLREIKASEEVVPEEAPTVEVAQFATERAIEANGGQPILNLSDTAAVECRVLGKGLTEVAVRHTAEFTIEAHDATGAKRVTGGDAFFVAIRGASRVRARIFDNLDGTYKVEWKPPQSGTYSIAVSYFGIALPGSPFTLRATTPVPFPPNCVATGAALNHAVARATQTFQVQYKDKLGNVRSLIFEPNVDREQLTLIPCAYLI